MFDKIDPLKVLAVIILTICIANLAALMYVFLPLELLLLLVGMIVTVCGLSWAIAYLLMGR